MATQPQTLIGLFGGTFDPIHFGHLAIAWEIVQQAQLDKLFFIPAANPPHRQAPQADAESRLKMITLAIENIPQFATSRCELDRPNLSYTIDTIDYFLTEMPTARLCLILGQDALLTLNTWHRWEEIMQKTHILVAKRPETAMAPPKWLQERQNIEKNCEKLTLLHADAPKICYYPVTQLSISATKIRRIFNEKHDPHFLMPKAVINYIKGSGLYQSHTEHRL